MTNQLKQNTEQPVKILSKNEHKRLMPVPGVFYPGGCYYMACRGLLLSSIGDLLVLTHGPVGCGYYSWWGGDRDLGWGEHEVYSFTNRSLSTNLQETDIIFGGEEKLMCAIGEAVALFHPQTIAICATCPVGLNGDDIKQIAAQAQEKFGVRILPFSCEGFKSIPGWLLGSQVMVEQVIGKGHRETGPYSLHVMGEGIEGKNRAEILSILGGTPQPRQNSCGSQQAKKAKRRPQRPSEVQEQQGDADDAACGFL